MVTEAGKELLRNTINTAKFHNRIIEENEMWKQFELERGLTMMVSDDLILKRINKKNHLCSKHRKRSKSKSEERSDRRDVSEAGSSKDGDRWDHSGFRELYPEEASNANKWDHSGFLELYPEEADNIQTSASQSKELTKEHANFKEKKKRKPIEVSSSDTEIWEEFKMYKRKKSLKKKREKSKVKPDSKSKTYDSHVKDWRKRTKDGKLYKRDS